GSGTSWPPRASSAARGAASTPSPPSFDPKAMTRAAVTPTDPTIDPDAERADLLRAILSGATLVMIGLSWPLWIDLADFPAVPFVGWFPNYPRGGSWLGLGSIVAGLVLGMTPRFGRAGVALAVVAMTWLIL